MPYATSDDLARAMPGTSLAALADDDGDGVADTPILESVLLLAEAYIDQQVGARYATPLDPAPEIARWWSVALALEALHARRAAEPSPALRNDADLARRALEAIHDGLATLAGATPRALTLLPDITREADEAIFTLENLEMY